MSRDESIAIPRELLFGMLARLVAASRQLGLIDEHSSHLAAESALANVDHVGRQIAELVGAPSDAFGSEAAASHGQRITDDEPTVVIVPRPKSR